MRARYSDLRCRVLRKRVIDVPLFTPTFRRPHLCYHMTDVMSHYAPNREPVTEHDRDFQLPSRVFLPLHVTFRKFAIYREKRNSHYRQLFNMSIYITLNCQISVILFVILFAA